MKSYNFQQGNVLSRIVIFDFGFVKMVCGLPNFRFPTVLLSDIAEISFDLFCIYFVVFGVLEIGTFTSSKIEGLVLDFGYVEYWKLGFSVFLIFNF